ncbi:MAG: hypothetical protein Kow0063_29710 [Anaerolineae bacterium]
MSDYKTGFESELYISLKPVLAILVILGVALYLLGDMLSYPLEVLDYTLFSLYALAIAGWLLFRWNPRAARWGMPALLLNSVYLAMLWLGVPGLLSFAAFPVLLAVPFIGLSGAAVTALVETMLLLLLARQITAEAGPAGVSTALMAVWAMLGVAYLVYHHIHRLSKDVWEYFQREQAFLEEARDHEMERIQALKDLADANIQLTRINRVAEGLRRAADDARRAKVQFVANVSHELRTPLNMITGFSEIILQSPETYGDNIPPALLADLAVIHRNAEHLSELIDDVLDLSQIDAEQMALAKEEVRFCEIVEDVTMAVRPLFRSKGLYLETRIPEDLPPLYCDRTRIREVLLNLLSNAGRFTERGGVCVSAWQERNDIVVSVADTGSGIAAEDMSRLFEPFHQVDGSIRRRYGGTGLGLSISKGFVELHNGKIWVESQEGLGTTFFFRLPLASPMPAGDDFLRGLSLDWEYAQRTRPSKAPKVRVRPRFVILETGVSLQRLLARYQDQVEIVSVASLKEALEEMARVPAQALLINSASVPGALRQFGQSKALPDGTPVIICSVPSMREASASLGASDRLVKPVSREELLGALDRLEVEKGTILIVDDEPDALHLFGRMLASSGREYRTLLARDGQEAKNILQERRPDAILLDLVMPHMDGFQLLEMKSQDPALREIPTIVISARDPAGQPIVSSALAVTRGGGLSARQLLACIQSLSQILSPGGQVDGPALTEARSD